MLKFYKLSGFGLTVIVFIIHQLENIIFKEISMISFLGVISHVVEFTILIQNKSILKHTKTAL